MNKVVHFEIPFDNEERAKKFYQDAFGWQILSVPEMNYIMATTVETDQQTMLPKTPGAINGGLMKRDSASGKSPVLVIDVQNLDEHLTKIKNSGGKVVMPKTEVGDMGLYARVADTEGNIIGVWQNKPRQ
jgi:predicted enzyme related to lactoylglutathione lyase